MTRKEAINEKWESKWKPLIYQDGIIDIELLKETLFDYDWLTANASDVYTELTGEEYGDPLITSGWAVITDVRNTHEMNMSILAEDIVSILFQSNDLDEIKANMREHLNKNYEEKMDIADIDALFDEYENNPPCKIVDGGN